MRGLLTDMDEAAVFVRGMPRFVPGPRTALLRAAGSVRHFICRNPHAVLHLISGCMDEVLEGAPFNVYSRGSVWQAILVLRLFQPCCCPIVLLMMLVLCTPVRGGGVKRDSRCSAQRCLTSHDHTDNVNPDPDAASASQDARGRSRTCATLHPGLLLNMPEN